MGGPCLHTVHEAAAFGCPGARGAGASRGGEKIVQWVLPFTNLPPAACDFDWKYLEKGEWKRVAFWALFRGVEEGGVKSVSPELFPRWMRQSPRSSSLTTA